MGSSGGFVLDAAAGVQGMGEPLHNLDAVLAAVDIMTDPLGLQLSHNKVLLFR